MTGLPASEPFNPDQLIAALVTACRLHAYTWSRPTTRDKQVMREQMLRARGIIA